MDEILQHYEVRKSNKDKTNFIEYIENRLSNAGYTVTVEEKGRGVLKSRNIIVGNPEEALVLFTAHYDTCAVLPFPNFMAPTNILLFAISQILITGLLLITAYMATNLFALLTNNIINKNLMYMIFLYGALFHMLFGYQNKHTANDNTSGVITITKILEKLPEEDRKKVCAVYFDNEEKGLFGSRFFYKKHGKSTKDKLLINFDCVGDGNTIISLAKKDAKKDALYSRFLDTMKECATSYDGEFIHGNMKTAMFMSDQNHFNKSVGICALRKSIFGMYAARIHTPFDTVCRKENIEFISDGAMEFLKKL